MPWWIASILANVAIAAVEYCNRMSGVHDSNLWDTLKMTAPMILIAQIGLYFAWRDAPSMMFAWAFFSVGNSLIRLASTYFLVGEPVGWLTVAGVSLMFGGALLVKS